jgi:endothelin-converting enzyme/putative endopeptidase
MRRCLIVSLALVAACKTAATKPAPSPTPAAVPVENRPMPPGLDLSAIDPAVNPCDDFYHYACGGWLKSATIPADRSAWSRGFYTIAEENEKRLHQILEAVGNGQPPAPTPYVKTLADLYAGCMDEPQHEAALDAAHKELDPLLGKLKEHDTKALADVAAKLHARGVGGLFLFTSSQDAKDATLQIGWVDQGGLGLPDRDYYLSDAPDKKRVRDAYVDHVEAVLKLWGETDAHAHAGAQTVLKLETRLAKASDTKVNRRDPKNTYHRLERDGLKKVAPEFAWDAYFKGMGTPDLKPINVTFPPFFKELALMAKTVSAKDWKPYLTFHYLDTRGLALPKAFQDEDFRFASKALTGAKEDRPRWKKCVGVADVYMGESLGAPFVELYFGADGKTRSLEVVNDIEAAFERNLGSLSWMDEPTRAQAQVKLKKIVNKIGYPDAWRNYDALATDRKDFLASLGNAEAFEVRRQLNKIGKPVDRKEWDMTPPTVNAYYNPQLNEVVFPAGILQAPFFNKDATFPVNFGAMGMVVGHEFTHGFDDEGAQYDGDGNLHDWWTSASATAFKERTACVKSQFDNYVAIDDLHLNGALTLGENVADLGGLRLAHAAMQEWVKGHADQVGQYRFNPDQQFFLGFAQSWCTLQRPERQRLLVTTDPHSPPVWRVNGPLGNLESFKQAFQCSANAKMVRQGADQCRVW